MKVLKNLSEATQLIALSLHYSACVTCDVAETADQYATHFIYCHLFYGYK